MTPDRPLRPPAGAVTDRVRSAILADAQRRGLDASGLLARHAEAEYLADALAVISDVEERHEMPAGALHERVTRRIRLETTRESVPPLYYGGVGAEFVLLALPDAEFLTAVEHTAGTQWTEYDDFDVDAFFGYVDGALRAHGAPYRRADDAWQFEWVGDPAQHALTVQPALLALADQRLDGARDEFEEALAKRRRGAPKDLEDAVDEAAKSVESVLEMLHHATAIGLPNKRQVSALFNSLSSPGAGVLPGYLQALVLAAAGLRNNMASHGQGASVREVPEALADASIAAAAVAITLLAHYLP